MFIYTAFWSVVFCNQWCFFQMQHALYMAFLFWCLYLQSSLQNFKNICTKKKLKTLKSLCEAALSLFTYPKNDTNVYQASIFYTFRFACLWALVVKLKWCGSNNKSLLVKGHFLGVVLLTQQPGRPVWSCISPYTVESSNSKTQWMHKQLFIGICACQGGKHKFLPFR